MAGFGCPPRPKQGQSASVTNGFLPTSVAGTQALFDGRPMTLLFVREDIINAIVPVELQPSGAFASQVVVTTSNASISAPFATFTWPAFPSLFTADGSGFGQGAIVNQDSTINSPTNPAPRGSVISVFGTGGGLTSPAYPDGQVILAATRILGGYYATIGLDYADIQYIGTAPYDVNGVMQVNLKVPDDVKPGPAVLLRLQVLFSDFTLGAQPVTVAIK